MQNNESQSSVAMISPTSFRIDNNIIRDIYNFNEQIGVDERLVRNIIYSVAEDYEHSLFGFGTIDPAVFAERWEYDPSYLRKRVLNPYQLGEMGEADIREYRERIRAADGTKQSDDLGDERIWDTHLENAIYILANKPFNFDTYGKFVVINPANHEEKCVKTHASFTLFSSISAAKRKNGKTVYTYTLNENFERNLTRYYIRGERESLLRLRGCSLDSLYLYLSNLKANLALEEQYTTSPQTGGPSFEHLCNLAGIPGKTKEGIDYQPKKRKQLLNRALEKINALTELKFSVKWGSAYGARGAYYPIFTFEGLQPPKDGKKSGYNIQRTIGNLERPLIHRLIIQREFLSMYKKLFPSECFTSVDPDAFNTWALDKDRNKEEKNTALKLAYIIIFKCIPKNANELNGLVMGVITSRKEPRLEDRLRYLVLPSIPDAPKSNKGDR